jgi:hypothetical protein
MSLIVDLIGYRYEEIDLIGNINSILYLYNISKYKQQLKPENVFYGITSLPSLEWRTSYFTHLQYTYLKLKEGLGLEPNDIYDDPEIKLELLSKYRLLGKSHLICHSYFYGYYVPVDFKDVNLQGSDLLSLGSSINLQNELLEIALYLDFDLNKWFFSNLIISNEKIPKILNEDELFRYAETVGLEIFGYEKGLLLQLYNVVLASIKYDLIITLSG